MESKVTPPVIPLFERDIARTCSDLLEADGWRMLVTDPVQDRARAKGFGELGMADRLYLRYSRAGAPGEIMWIEWKRIRRGHKAATKPTSLQRIWHEHERLRGAFTLIAGVDFPATIDGFIAWYGKSGLARRKF